MEGSVLEDRILRDSFQVDSISTARLFALANMQQIPILTIDSTNVDAFLDSNNFASSVELDLRNAASSGQTIRILSQEFFFEDWQGIGYIKEDNQTGESAWMLSGDIAGGMVVWDKSRWDDYFFDRILNPFAESASFDSTLHRSIQKLALSDLQTKKVGESVVVSVRVFDEKDRGIAGENVLFIIKSGGGHFSDGTTSVSQITGHGGIASAVLTLGLHTKDNPCWRKSNPSDEYAQQLGQNIVDARLVNGYASIEKPFVIYGEPDWESKQAKFSQDSTQGDPRTFAGCLHVAFEDQFGNDIFNDVVEFVAEQLFDPTTNLSEINSVLIDPTDPCVGRFPTHEECQTETSMMQKIAGPGGASTCVILGSIRNATQNIRASYGSSQSHYFSISINDFGHDYADAQPPEYRFYVIPEEHHDEHGNKVVVARAGEEFPVGVRMMLLREDSAWYPLPWKIGYLPDPASNDSFGCLCRAGEVADPDNPFYDEYNYKCLGNNWPHFGIWYHPTDTKPAYKYVGNGITKIDYEFKNEVVTFFNGQTSRLGTKTDKGYYSARIPIERGLNTIGISASAQTKVPLDLCFDCEELGRPCVNRPIQDGSYCYCDMLIKKNNEVYADQTSIQTITIYGIDFDTDETAIVALNDDNKSSSDVVIPFKILPVEYSISNALLEITKDGVPISYAAIDDNSDSVTVSRGFQFDPGSEYKAQIVLNHNTSYEIRSDDVQISFMKLSILADINRNEKYDKKDQYYKNNPGAVIASPRGQGAISSEGLLPIEVSFVSDKIVFNYSIVLDLEQDEEFVRVLRIDDNTNSLELVPLPYVVDISTKSMEEPLLIESLRTGFSRLTAKLIKNGTIEEYSRDTVSINSVNIDVAGFEPGTMERPGLQLSEEFEEEDPDSVPKLNEPVNGLNLPINVDCDDISDTGFCLGVADYMRDNKDSKISENDNDISKIRFVVSGNFPSKGFLKISITPEESLRVFSDDNSVLPNELVIDLESPEGPAAVLAHGESVSVFVEATGLPMNAMATLSYHYSKEETDTAIVQDVLSIHPSLIHVLREKTYFAASELSSGGLKFPSTNSGIQANSIIQEYWANKGPGMTLQDNVFADEALKNIFVNTDNYIMECASASYTILCKAALDTYLECDRGNLISCPPSVNGLERYRDVFSNLSIAGFITALMTHYGLALSTVTSSSDSVGALKYISNPACENNLQCAALQGENLILMSSDFCSNSSIVDLGSNINECWFRQYAYGHSKGIHEIRWWLYFLTMARPAGATEIPYLQRESIVFDEPSFSRILLGKISME